jgi:hydroxypyruvate isomerase
MEVRLQDQSTDAAGLKVQLDTYNRQLMEGEGGVAEEQMHEECERLRTDNRQGGVG